MMVCQSNELRTAKYNYGCTKKHELLKLTWFAADYGRYQIVNAVTRGVHTLDLCFTNRPNSFKCSVVTTVSDHEALVICGSDDNTIFDTAKLKSLEIVEFF